MITCAGCTAIYPDELDTCPHCGVETPRGTGTADAGSYGDELRLADLDAPVRATAVAPGIGVESP